jgi:hypothetical protein
MMSVPVEAKKKKAPNYGTVKIKTAPAGYDLTIDNQPQGKTTSEYREFDLAPGVHTIGIELAGGQHWTRQIDLPAGRIKCLALSYRPSIPIVTSPCPFPVRISAPGIVSDGELITFTADASYRENRALNYSWTVTPSSAKVINGAGTPTITVDSTGLAGQRLVATLIVDDGTNDPLCRQTVQAATSIPPRADLSPAREFDVCCACTFDDQKARLDNLAVELQRDPTAMAYIIAYSGRGSRIGQADFLGTRARDYLVMRRGMDRSRIVIVNGGVRDEDCVELWIVPQGAKPPQPRPMN